MALILFKTLLIKYLCSLFQADVCQLVRAIVFKILSFPRMIDLEGIIETYDYTLLKVWFGWQFGGMKLAG